MRVGQSKFICVNGHAFVAPRTRDYGEFILHSAGLGTPRYMHAISDRTYNEAIRILGLVQNVNARNDRDKSDILEKAFGIACDPDIDGTEFQMGSMPKCPECGSREMDSWDYPDGFETVEVQEITHTAWQQLRFDEKLDHFTRRLAQLGFLHEPRM